MALNGDCSSCVVECPSAPAYRRRYPQDKLLSGWIIAPIERDAQRGLHRRVLIYGVEQDRHHKGDALDLRTVDDRAELN